MNMEQNIQVPDVEDLKLRDEERCRLIKQALMDLYLDNEKIKRICNVFESEMELALHEKPSSLQMENTYIPELLDGTESGVFLALDLGGTNFRVILMELKNNHVIREDVKHYHIDDELRIGCGFKLFDFLANCVDEFVKEENMPDDEIIPLGFTFSFPMRQHSLDSGVLVTWTKSFNCPSVVDKDAVKLLKDSLHKIGRKNIDILAILNDTTGTLIQGAALDKNTRIGIVLGTGSNGCYLEHANRVQHWETQRHNEKNVIIDVEWGAFGDNGVLDFMKTKYDREVDEGSLLANSFTFEKYISGKYLGELCRIILRDLVEENLLLRNVDMSRLPKPWKFNSDNVSKIETDTNEKTDKNVKEILNGLGYEYEKHYDADDIRIIQYVCGLISLRAATLIACTTSVLLQRMDENEVTIAIDGSVYKHHPRLRYWIKKMTSELTPNKKNKFILAEDGSGKGAALVAAIAKRIGQRKLSS